jgi:RES domain-containing protein
VRYKGKLFRALNPVFAREPLSGRGAELYGGRFNPKGVPALYTAVSVLAAVREANQVGSLQPTTLVSYEANFDRIFDARDEAALAAFGMTSADLSDPSWRDQMIADGKSKTQAFAEKLIFEGYQGILVSSFAHGATDEDLNLVLWSWGRTPSASLRLIDDEGRLKR